MKIVRVVWDDAFSDNMDWASLEQLEAFASDNKKITINHVGYQVSKTKKYLTLVMAYCKDNDTCSGIFKIPIKMISEYEVLVEDVA